MNNDPLASAVEGLRAHVLRCRALAIAIRDVNCAAALGRLADAEAADAERLAQLIGCDFVVVGRPYRR
jgi:hypothetical protein